MARQYQVLSRPISARFDPADLEDILAESRATGIDGATLIRRDVRLFRALLARRRGFRFSQVTPAQLEKIDRRIFDPYFKSSQPVPEA